jgi:hypothetical protein
MRLVNLQRVEYLEHIVRRSLYSISGGGLVEGADPASRTGVDVNLIRQLRSDLVVHICPVR